METPLSREELLKKIEAKENVSKVDTSEIKDMKEMFCVDFVYDIYRGRNFNQPLNDWDVSNVEYMDNMFNGAESFNQPLNNWDVSKVKNMYGMFSCAKSFNQPLNDWDVSNVEEMSYMFQHAMEFNQPLNDWDVSNVMYMTGMFRHAYSFNQSLNNWDVSNVKNMKEMFWCARRYVCSMKNWRLNPDCASHGLVQHCHAWHMFNTQDDLPMNNYGRRIYARDNAVWKIL